MARPDLPFSCFHQKNQFYCAAWPRCRAHVPECSSSLGEGSVLPSVEVRKNEGQCCAALSCQSLVVTEVKVMNTEQGSGNASGPGMYFSRITCLNINMPHVQASHPPKLSAHHLPSPLQICLSPQYINLFVSLFLSYTHHTFAHHNIVLTPRIATWQTTQIFPSQARQRAPRQVCGFSSSA